MTKADFLISLHDQLSGLPRQEVQERANFYSEMIDDRMEDGLTETEAVAAIGPVEQIISQIISEISLTRIAREKIRIPGNRIGWHWVLLILGFPLWFSVLAAAAAVMVSVYVSIWSVIISLWAASGSMAVTALTGVMAGMGYIIAGYTATGVALIGAALVLAGLSVFLYIGIRYTTRGVCFLTKKTGVSMKHWLIKRRKTNA